ncbi:MAG: glycoside hydrolase family 13 protein [Nocardioidaceae bacterium]
MMVRRARGRSTAQDASEAPWWRDAVCYQIYVRSFADANADGMGDLAGVRKRLEYVRRLGVDAVWLTPFYPSPQHDAGYDVADYRAVDRQFGTMRSFDSMMSRAHTLGLKVIIDIVPNHTSSAHRWFREAVADEPGSPSRDRYLIRDGLGSRGERPPNNWRSTFGGPAWTRLSDGQWYLHLFDSTQPDLNWRNREVVEEFDQTLRFWLDRGVDGFRIDVAHGLFKASGLPATRSRGLTTPYWDQPEVHTVYRRWHALLASYPGDRMSIGEVWAATPQLMARYLRADELQQAFNFKWLESPWSAAAFRRVIEQTFAAVGPTKASPTWVLSNHDVVRTVTRYGDGSRGLARAKAAMLTMLSLPGSAYIYQGEELGLPQVDVPVPLRQDPTWHHGGGVGRDGCRIPMPWTADGPSYGFSRGEVASWLPQPRGWGALSVEAQERDPGSTLAFFRAALQARRQLLPSLAQRVRFGPSRPGVLVVKRAPGLTCVLNCSRRDHQIVGSAYGEPLIASGQREAVAAGVLPPDTAAWFLKN